MAFAGISDNKRHLTKSNGQPFFVIGANYQGYPDWMWRLWEDGKFDPERITRDFRKMADAGLNVARIFVSASLMADIQADNFDKLDSITQIAADHRLMILLTLNGSHQLDLAEVGALDASLVDRYQYDPVILGWDLESDLRFYHLAAAKYPANQPAPIRTNALVNHYEPRLSQQQALKLQSQQRIPAHLTPQQAYYYINALEYITELNADAAQWISKTGKSIVAYLKADEAAKWHPLIEVLNDTLAAWLNIRLEPIRKADPNHLITMGHNWPLLAGLRANDALDFQQYHCYGAASLAQLNQTFQKLTDLQTTFPKHPVLLGEFGYTNQSTSNSATAMPISDQVTALYEAAVLTYLRAEDYAGGLKWMLNDAEDSSNPSEASFGMYRISDQPKSICELTAHFNQTWAAPPAKGTVTFVQDPIGLAMRFDLSQQVMLSGGTFQDAAFSWQADGIVHCFITREENALSIKASGVGQLSFEPSVMPNWVPGKSVVLMQMINGSGIEQGSFGPNMTISWRVLPNITYQLTLAESVIPMPSDDAPNIRPNPGEHVILLADADKSLQAALPYIRKFAPDMSFVPEQVIGRWAYVTVVGTEKQIPNAVISQIMAHGAQIVDRIGTDARAILADLVRQNRRFLSTELINPPTEPPSDATLTAAGNDVPPTAEAHAYIVKPGDSLNGLALKLYGKASLWSTIFEANRDILDTPNQMRPGMVLKIPSGFEPPFE